MRLGLHLIAICLLAAAISARITEPPLLAAPPVPLVPPEACAPPEPTVPFRFSQLGLSGSRGGLIGLGPM